jgi:hypothetical protein
MKEYINSIIPRLWRERGYYLDSNRITVYLYRATLGTEDVLVKEFKFGATVEQIVTEIIRDWSTRS